VKVEQSRPYRMRARAEATEATRARILEATVETFWDSPTMDIALDDVASTAGVSVQTVLRHFGSKDRLFEAAVERESARVGEQRDEAPVGDVHGAVKVLVDHYEEMGDRVLRVLAEEQRTPALARVVDIGRTEHRAWCERVFASALARRNGVDRQRLLAQLVAICDAYMWKLLRRDSALSRRQTELAVIEMLTALVEVE